MSTTILRSRILDLAIRGQLVPQDPNEGTADDLLKAIAAQRGKAITPITDNVPFDIPANWRWVKLGDIIQHNTGKTLNERKNIGTIKRKYITTSNVYWSGIDLSSVKETLFTEQEIEKYSAIKGDLLVCEGGDVGRAAIWDKDEEICFQNHLHRLRTYVPMNIKYFFYIFYNFKLQGRIKGKGIGIDGLSSGVVDKLSLPLPPLAEQHRIVAKVEELLSEVDKIEQAQADITQAATILRSRVLDSALKGELTHSNTEERENVKLGDVCSFQNGYAFDSHDYCTEGTPLIRIGDIKEGKVNFEKCVFVNKQVGDNFLVHKGDLLIAMSGASTGKIGIYEEEKKAYLNQRVGNIKIEDNSKIIPQYRNLFLQSQSDTIYKLAYGGAQPNISGKMILGLSIPLPPLAEQHRIVAKIEQLFTEIDKLVK